MLHPDTGEPPEIDSVLERYLDSQSGLTERGKIEVLEQDPGRNFYRLKREEPPKFNDSDIGVSKEEVFLNPRESSPILRRIRSVYKGSDHLTESVEILNLRDNATTLFVQRSIYEGRDLLHRRKTETNYKANYKVIEPAERERGTLGVHTYRLGYRNGEIGTADINLYSNAFSSKEKPADISFEFEKNGIIGHISDIKGKIKVEYGKPLQVGSTSLVVNKNGGQLNLEVTLADGLIRTLSFPQQVDIQSWLTQFSEDGEEWIEKGDQFPVRLSIHSVRDTGEV